LALGIVDRDSEGKAERELGTVEIKGQIGVGRRSKWYAEDPDVSAIVFAAENFTFNNTLLNSVDSKTGTVA
jgi:hypothetical protein